MREQAAGYLRYTAQFCLSFSRQIHFILLFHNNIRNANSLYIYPIYLKFFTLLYLIFIRGKIILLLDLLFFSLYWLGLGVGFVGLG